MSVDEFIVEIEAEDSDTGEPVRLAVDWKNFESVKLLIWELAGLVNDMRVGASPFTERLESALRRFGLEEVEGEEP